MAHSEFVKLTLRRKREDKLSFITCDEEPGLFISWKYKRGASLRAVITKTLELHFARDSEKVSVLLERDMRRAEIGAVVHLKGDTIAHAAE